MKTTKTLNERIHNKSRWRLLAVLAALLFFNLFSCPLLKAQVTIGDATPPQDFSILEIVTTTLNKGGIRLPHLTTGERETLEKSATFQNEIVKKGRGLTIFNITTNCVEYWNSKKWISMCQGSGNFTGGDCAENPVSEAGETVNCTITDPDCDTEGEYTFTIISGADYTTLLVTDAGAGSFTLTFDVNDRASERQAIVMVTSPCGTTAIFVYTQKGDDAGCGVTTVPDIKSVGDVTAMCARGAVYLYLDGYPATGTFIWTLNGQQVGQGNNYTATAPGKYIVYGDKIGCPDSKIIQITLDGTGAPDPVAIIVRGNNGLVCGADGTTRLIAAKPVTGTVRWFKNGVLQALTSPDNEVEAGVGQWVAVVSEGTCWSTPSDVITVAVDPNSGTSLTKPVIVKGGDFCAGSSVQLSVSSDTYNAAYTYTWYENNAQVGTGQNILYSVPTGVESVVIRCRATMGGSCSAEAMGTETITTGTIPSRPVITGDKQLCSGTATLNAVPSGSGSFTYAWYKGDQLYATTQSITVNDGGEYSVTVTDGCTSPAAKISISEISSAIPTVTLNRSAENPNQNDMVTYAASINFTPATAYVWTISNATLMSGGGNSANAVVKFDQTGTASVKVDVNNACGTGTATHNVADVQPLCADPATVSPSLPTNIKSIVNVGVTLGPVSATFVSGTPGTSYQWYSNTAPSTTGGTGISGATNNTYIATNSTVGTYYYYCEVKNAGCNSATMATGLYTVVVSDPAGNPIGTGTFSGKTCFDVVEINDGGSCSTLASRTSQKTDFSKTATNTQTYTYTTSGAISKIRFYAVDQTGQVIESIDYDENLETATNLSGTFTVTVKYKTNLNSTASGKDRDNGLNAMLYVVYNSNANGSGGALSDRRLELKVAVQDCTCCPGYMALGGEYVQKVGGYLNIGAPLTFAQISVYFTATGKDVCFYKTDANSGIGTNWETATANCKNGSYVDPEHSSMGWRLPTVVELGALQDIHTTLSTQPTSAPGTTNMLTNIYWSSTEYSSTYSWSWLFHAKKATYPKKSAFDWIRCVRSF